MTDPGSLGEIRRGGSGGQRTTFLKKIPDGLPPSWGVATSISKLGSPGYATSAVRHHVIQTPKCRQPLKSGFLMLSSVLFSRDIKSLSFCVISSLVSDKSPSLWVCSHSSQGFLFGKAGEILTKRLRYMVFRSMLRQVCLWMCRTPHLGPTDSGSGSIVRLFGAAPALLFPRSRLTDADEPLPRCRFRGPAVSLSAVGAFVSAAVGRVGREIFNTHHLFLSFLLYSGKPKILVFLPTKWYSLYPFFLQIKIHPHGPFPHCPVSLPVY